MIARAYMYSGMWVADCPRPCNNTEMLREDFPGGLSHRKTVFLCSYCGLSTTGIEWPPDAEEIEAVLSLRPVPHNRNWYPEDHPVAIRFRIPHGQTVGDLRAENHEHNVPVL